MESRLTASVADDMTGGALGRSSWPGFVFKAGTTTAEPAPVGVDEAGTASRSIFLEDPVGAIAARPGRSKEDVGVAFSCRVKVGVEDEEEGIVDRKEPSAWLMADDSETSTIAADEALLLLTTDDVVSGFEAFEFGANAWGFDGRGDGNLLLLPDAVDALGLGGILTELDVPEVAEFGEAFAESVPERGGLVSFDASVVSFSNRILCVAAGLCDDAESLTGELLH